jgi:hypothetical protein
MAAMTGKFVARLPKPATVIFAIAGFLAYLTSAWLLKTNSVIVLILVSVSRLMFASIPPALVAKAIGWSNRGSMAALAIATPYPVDLAVFAYWEWALAIPESWASRLNSPVTFVLFVAGVLLASRRLTAWAVGRALGQQGTERLRQLGGVLFALTAAGLILGRSPTGILWFLSHLAEPLAMTGYCAILGAGPPDRPARQALSIVPMPPGA